MIESFEQSEPVFSPELLSARSRTPPMGAQSHVRARSLEIALPPLSVVTQHRLRI